MQIFFIPNIFRWRALTALMVCLCLLMPAGTVAAAGPENEQPHPPQIEPVFAIPAELGSVDEMHKSGSSKWIIYIQDAHASLEAQENIAALITHLTGSYGISSVYQEGYEGPVPTKDYFAALPDPQLRERTAYFFMDKLRLGGAEYAHVLHPDNFHLQGVEDLNLYRANMEWARKAGAVKETAAGELDILRNELKRLIDERFGKEFKEWLRYRERLDHDRISLLDYLKRLHKMLDSRLAPQAFQETFPAVHSLLEMAEGRTEDEPREDAVEPARIFAELQKLEARAALLWIKTDIEMEIWEAWRHLAVLQRLVKIKVTAAEYETVRSALKHFDSAVLAALIARAAGKPAVLSDRWEGLVQPALRFYETVRDRDGVLEQRLEAFKAGRENTAVLVFGGFHKDKIRALLREKDISYLIVSPRIRAPSSRHEKYYETLLFQGTHRFEQSLPVMRALRVESVYVMEDGAGQVERAYREVQPYSGLPVDDFLLRLENALSESRQELRAAGDVSAAKDVEAARESMLALLMKLNGAQEQERKAAAMELSIVLDRILPRIREAAIQDSQILHRLTGTLQMMSVFNEPEVDRRILSAADVMEGLAAGSTAHIPVLFLLIDMVSPVKDAEVRILAAQRLLGLWYGDEFNAGLKNRTAFVLGAARDLDEVGKDEIELTEAELLHLAARRNELRTQDSGSVMGFESIEEVEKFIEEAYGSGVPPMEGERFHVYLSPNKPDYVLKVPRLRKPGPEMLNPVPVPYEEYREVRRSLRTLGLTPDVRTVRDVVLADRKDPVDVEIQERAVVFRDEQGKDETLGGQLADYEEALWRHGFFDSDFLIKNRGFIERNKKFVLTSIDLDWTYDVRSIQSREDFFKFLIDRKREGYLSPGEKYLVNLIHQGQGSILRRRVFGEDDEGRALRRKASALFPKAIKAAQTLDKALSAAAAKKEPAERSQAIRKAFFEVLDEPANHEVLEKLLTRLADKFWQARGKELQETSETRDAPSDSRAELRISSEDVSSGFDLFQAVRDVRGDVHILLDAEDFLQLNEDQQREYEVMAVLYPKLRLHFYGVSPQTQSNQDLRKVIEEWKELRELLGIARVTFTPGGAQQAFMQYGRSGTILHFSKKKLYEGEKPLRDLVPEESRRRFFLFRYLTDETGLVAVALAHSNSQLQGLRQDADGFLTMTGKLLAMKAREFAASLVFARAA